jgi:hypothetical protein
MDTLATNFAIALSAKDDIIEQKDKENEELRQLVEQLKREKEIEFREKTELQSRLDAVISQNNNNFNNNEFNINYEEDNDFDFSIRRSRRKRRPKKVWVLGLKSLCFQFIFLVFYYKWFSSVFIALNSRLKTICLLLNFFYYCFWFYF